MHRKSIAALTLVAISAVAVALYSRTTTPDPLVASTQLAETVEPAVPSAGVPAAGHEVDPPSNHTETVRIGRRDTMVAALLRHEVSGAIAHRIASALREAGAELRKVRPGDRFDLARDREGRVVAAVYAPSPWQRFEAGETDGHWRAGRIDIEPDVRIELRQGEIRRSLWDAVESGAVTAPLLLDFAQMLESEFDFAADAQPGDRFRLLVEARYANGALVDYGRIVAAQYVSDGQTLTGIGFAGGGRHAYYDPAGQSLKKMFLRSPLQFTRISSGFTHRRPHPILGGVRPHLAIDYAAPTGTPVWAVADGEVSFAGRNGGNGIQVVVHHRAGYRTYYNHLSRVAKGIRSGARVRQKQIVGYVGSTGLSTGPHLDYRVSRHGRFVNPLLEKFLPGDPIPQPLRARFAEHSRTLVERLEREAPFRP